MVEVDIAVGVRSIKALIKEAPRGLPRPLRLATATLAQRLASYTASKFSSRRPS